MTEQGPIQIIGIDSASDVRKIGVCVAEYRDKRIVNLGIPTFLAEGEQKDDGVQKIADSLSRQIGRLPTVLAVDAPLGWPTALAEGIRGLEAGEHLSTYGVHSMHDLFKRITDIIVWDLLDKQPLELGASWISRASVRTLCLLQRIRRVSSKDFPLLLGDLPCTEDGIIEVYPAGTLAALNECDAQAEFPTSYKGKEDGQKANRKKILDLVDRPELFPNGISNEVADACVADDNLLDSLLCVVAGVHFLRGKCMDWRELDGKSFTARRKKPDPFPVTVTEERIRREGWIWVKAPKKEWTDELEITDNE